jgi:hypothetical protein
VGGSDKSKSICLKRIALGVDKGAAPGSFVPSQRDSNVPR